MIWMWDAVFGVVHPNVEQNLVKSNISHHIKVQKPLQKHYSPLRKKEMVKDLHHLVDLELNYLIAMDEDNKEDIDAGKNDNFLDF